MRKTLMGLAVIAVLAAPTAAMADETYQCDSGGDPTLAGKSIAFNGKQFLWPPNHKYSAYSVTATDENGQDVRLTLTGRSDETVYDNEGNAIDEWNGAGHTPFLTDVKPNPATGTGSGSVTVDQAARAERSGRGDGRTYTITALAEYGADAGPLGFMTTQTCKHDFLVSVPHDLGNH